MRAQQMLVLQLGPVAALARVEELVEEVEEVVEVVEASALVVVASALGVEEWAQAQAQPLGVEQALVLHLRHLLIKVK